MEKNNLPKRRRFNKIALLITYAVFLFAIAYRFDAVWNWIKWFFSALSPVLTGLVLAYLFHMPTDFFQHRLLASWEKDHRLKKLWPGVSMILGYASVIILLIGLLWLVLPKVYESLRMLALNFSSYLMGFESWADGVLSSMSMSPSVTAVMDNAWDQLAGQLQKLVGIVAGGALSFTMSFTSRITDFCLAFIFSIFLLASRGYVFKSIMAVGSKIMGRERANEAARILRISDNVFSGFVIGKLLDGLILGVMCFICMNVLKMEFTPLISVIIGVTELVPIVGPIVGTTACALILLMVNPEHVVTFVILVCVLQIIENYIIYPRLMGNALGLPGVWVILSIIVGGGLFGLWGMLLGTPIFVVVYRLIGEEWGIKQQVARKKE